MDGGLAEQPLTRESLAFLAKERLREAKVLLHAGCWSGAYYLAGYAVELAFRRGSPRRSGQRSFPNFVQRIYSHKLSDLVSLAGLKARLEERSAKELPFADSWETVLQWSEQSRYRVTDQLDAETLVAAIDGAGGLVQWILTQTGS